MRKFVPLYRWASTDTPEDMRFVTLLLIFLPAMAPPLSAQEANPLSLRVGDRIRLSDARAGAVRVDGRVAVIESLQFGYTVIGDDHVYMRPYAEIDTIDVRRRLQRKSAVDGAMWGAFLGAATGAIVGPFAAKTMPMGTGPAVAVFAAGGGFAGALVGGAIGAIVKPARWYRHVFH